MKSFFLIRWKRMFTAGFRISTLTFFTITFSTQQTRADSGKFEAVEVILSRIEAKASSTLDEWGSLPTTYSPEKVLDGDEKTAWCEGKKGPGIGEWIEFAVPGAFANAIVIENGIFSSKKLYQANNRIKDYTLIITYKDGTTDEISDSFKDECAEERPGGPCKIAMDDPRYHYDARWDKHGTEFSAGCVTKVRLTIRSVYPGEKYNDTCITEMRFYHVNVFDGHKEPYVDKLEMPNPTAKVSSVLVEKGREPTSYLADKTFDGDLATAWCEGKPGAGVGEWIEATFPPTIAWGVWVMNGLAANPGTYKNNNRVKDYTIVITTKGGGKIEKRGKFEDECISSRERRCQACRKVACDCEANCKPGVDETCSETDYPESVDNPSYIIANSGLSLDHSNQLVWSNHVISFERDEEYWGRFEPLCITGIKLKIGSIYNGAKYDDTCVSEIRLVKIVPTKDGFAVQDPDANQRSAELLEKCK